jgi:hypothetical protein
MKLRRTTSIVKIIERIESSGLEGAIIASIVNTLYDYYDGPPFLWLSEDEVSSKAVAKLNSLEYDWEIDNPVLDIEYLEEIEAEFTRYYTSYISLNKSNMSDQLKHAIMCDRPVTILDGSISLVNGLRVWNCPMCEGLTFLWNYKSTQPCFKGCYCMSEASHIKYGLLLERDSPYIHRLKEDWRKTPKGVVKNEVLKTFINQFELESIAHENH